MVKSYSEITNTVTLLYKYLYIEGHRNKIFAITSV